MKVVVVGAGIIGAAVADALVRRGAEVTVLDMRAPGAGATQASAGMLAPYTEAPGHGHLLELGVRSLGRYDDLIAGLRSDTGRSIEYARTGTLEVALDEARAEELRAGSAALRATTPAEWLAGGDLFDREPAVARRAIGGLFVPAHGFVGAEDLLDALVHRATFSGAVFVSPIEVGSIEQRGEHVEIRADSATIEADVAVVASGSWSRRVRVAHVSALPVRPVRGQLLHLKIAGEPRPRQIVWGPGCYTVPWSDGSLLVGATVEDAGFEESATVGGVHALTRSVMDLLPATASAVLESVRVGLRPALVDGLPAIGPLGRAPRVVVATGHYRNGVLLAPITADIVTRHILDGATDPAIAFTSPDRLVA